MDSRTAKLALARKKLKDHQDKKNSETVLKSNVLHSNSEHENNSSNEQDSSESTIYQDIPNPKTYSLYEQNENNSAEKTDINAIEFLVSSKRNLELQITNLYTKNIELEKNLTATTEKYEVFVKKYNTLENELKNLSSKYKSAIEQLQIKDISLKELNDCKSLNLDEKLNLQEQLDLTKSILTAKETENDSLHSQLFNIQSQLDVAQLQLQQLTSGAHDTNNEQTQETLRRENEVLVHKLTNLEQQLRSQVKDYQQIKSHYEHYVGELNEQLKSVTHKNEDLNKELQNLTHRESSLIEHISEMEIQIQNYNRTVHENTVSESVKSCDLKDFKELQDNYDKSLGDLQQLRNKYEVLQNLYDECNVKIEELSRPKEFMCKQTNEVSLLKLNADITSDKVAAQRATEQNKKLKHDLQGLEETVVKMTKDKLDLTEKITAEKYLNRELTIKLAETDEKANNLHATLKAKDEEMIRLQAAYRNLERAHEELRLKSVSKETPEQLNNNDIEKTQEKCEIEPNDEVKIYNNEKSEHRAFIEYPNDSSIPKGDAMFKLQERFLKIMGEVADLSDEKHRLEHIIMQLQNETDTICEYVALYQQQRSLLKRRDEERSAQMKIFQSECNRLQNQLDELTDILKRFEKDNELSSYFQNQSKHEDIQKVMSLLSHLRNNSLLDPRKTIEFKNFYPCSCCSGQLIEV